MRLQQQRRRWRRHHRHFPLIKVKATAIAATAAAAASAALLEVKRRFVRLLALGSDFGGEGGEKGRKQTRNLVVANDRWRRRTKEREALLGSATNTPSLDRSIVQTVQSVHSPENEAIESNALKQQRQSDHFTRERLLPPSYLVS